MSAFRGATNHVRPCGQPGPRERLLAGSGFDNFEIRALEVMRLIFAGMSKTRPRYAPDTVMVAHTLFGCHRGGILLAGLTAFVQTMAMSRSENFRYANPFCAGCAAVVTENELHLLSILHHSRRGATGRAMTYALFLCDARPVAALLDAAADLASLAPLTADATLPPAAERGAGGR
ncbi:hypothetical protein [Pseudotabrizicola sp. 4114]|uniref:hypothetical protein n=1 Tax=Pseudotabrizicola sp. 4114 TaxID=2817731 RepID=UPI0028552DBB|nr:hypothetical protein [Pseudorhodobacter sp. 4114]